MSGDQIDGYGGPAAQGDLVLDGAVRARANINVALIKYWGKASAKAPEDANLPAVPSLSLTLDGLYTETTVRFAPDLEQDRCTLGGAPLTGEALARVSRVLDVVRRRAGVASAFDVRSFNHVPTAAGLASSASSMAALAAAASRCAGLPDDPAAMSALARIGSGSASRSIFGGWVVWDGPAARPVYPAGYWDLAVVVAVVDAGRKKIGSRAAMNRTARTSPLYGPWVEQARGTLEAALEALEARDLGALCQAMELSTMRMHASAMASSPPILYWQAPTLAVLREVERMREGGVPCGYTMDAGPNVKILCDVASAHAIAARVGATAGVRETYVTTPGGGVSVELVTQGAS